MPIRTSRCALGAVQVVLLLALGRPGFAADLPRERPGDLEILPLLEEALGKSPELAATTERAAAARARISPLRALPDPTASLVYQNGGGRFLPGENNDTFFGISVVQAIPFEGKRRFGADVATREAERIAISTVRARLSLEAALRNAYADLLLGRALIEVFDEQRRTWEEAEGTAQSRYAAGVAPQQELLRAQAEKARLIPMRRHEEGNVAMAIASINRILGRAAGAPLDTPRLLPEVAAGVAVPALSDYLAAAEEKSPEIVEARLAIARRAAMVDRAKAELKPDLFTSATYLNRGGMAPMVSGSIGLSLPIYTNGKQRQAIVEAQAEKQAAEAALSAVRLSVRVNLERNYAEWIAALAEAEPYPRGILELDRLSVESALSSYRVGKLPFASVLEALQTLFGDKRAYFDRLAHVLWHEASLSEFVPAAPAGGLPLASR